MTTQAQSVAINGSQINSSGVLLPAGGGTGVNITTTDLTVHGITVGLGGGSVAGNTAVGNGALQTNTVANNNTAVGYQAGYSNTAGAITAVGYQALYSNQSNGSHVAVGNSALQSNTTGWQNTAVGSNSMQNNLSGNYNTALGYQSLQANTTADNNTAVGYQAGYSNALGGGNTFVGYQSGYTFAFGSADNNNGNAFFGNKSGYAVTNGYNNTFIGSDAGSAMTTGTANTIIGHFTGNQNGLDIRTAGNYIVLSDGDGYPRQVIDGSGNAAWPASLYTSTDANGVSIILSDGSVRYWHQTGSASGSFYALFNYAGAGIGSINQNGTTGVLYNTTSDYRLKENVTPIANGLDAIKALNPVMFDWKSDGSEDSGFIAHEFQAVIPRSVTGTKDAVDEEGNPVYQAMDSKGAIPFLVAAIKEQQAIIEAQAADIAALKAKVGI